MAEKSNGLLQEALALSHSRFDFSSSMLPEPSVLLVQTVSYITLLRLEIADKEFLLERTDNSF